MKKLFLPIALFVIFSSISIVVGGVLGGKLTFFLSEKILGVLIYAGLQFSARFIIGIFFSLLGYSLGVIAIDRNISRGKHYLLNLGKETTKTLSYLILIFSARFFVVGFCMGVGYVGLVVVLFSII